MRPEDKNTNVRLVAATQIILMAATAIGALWVALELVIYGERCPRLETDLNSLAWTAMALCTYSTGLEHGKLTPRK